MALKAIPESPQIPPPKNGNLSEVGAWMATMGLAMFRILKDMAYRANRLLPKDGSETMTGPLPLLSQSSALPTPPLSQDGQLGFRDDTNALQVWHSGVWNTVGGGGGAPTDAEYIVGAVHAGLSAERVVTDTPTIAWDLGTVGQAKANIPAATDLSNNARVAVRKNTGGADVGKRRRLNLIEGSNVTLTVVDDAGSEEVDITIAAAGGSGNFGNIDINFGATPAEEATVAVTGQAAILATSHVEAWFMADTTVDNGIDEHREAAALCPLVVESVVAGTGFTIRAQPIAMLGIGTYKVHWSWG